jgi:hypothetical protein
LGFPLVTPGLPKKNYYEVDDSEPRPPDQDQVKRVRGVAYTTKISPQARRARQFHSKINGKMFEVNGYFWSHRADEYEDEFGNTYQI